MRGVRHAALLVSLAVLAGLPVAVSATDPEPENREFVYEYYDESPKLASGSLTAAVPETLYMKSTDRTVIVLADVDTAGCPQDVRIAQGYPGYADAVLAAARAVRFEPARLRGRAVAVTKFAWPIDVVLAVPDTIALQSEVPDSLASESESHE
jgi:hypothetical protein